MSTTRMPGFTAEASVYRTAGHYRMTESPAQASGAIRPATFLDRRCYAACRGTCDCSGLSGSDFGRCLRECNWECREVCTR